MTREQIEQGILALEGQGAFGGQLMGWPTRARTFRDALRAHRGEPWAAAAYDRLRTACLGLSAADSNHESWDPGPEL